MEQVITPLNLEEKPKLMQRIDVRLVLGGFLIVLLGIGSGWGLSRLTSRGRTGVGGINLTGGKTDQVKEGETYGQTSDAFKDKAVGVVEADGANGEGTHKLLREGGESQTVFMTSSVVDLDMFVGHKVEVQGETFAAQKAGWLMDIGAVKVLE